MLAHPRLLALFPFLRWMRLITRDTLRADFIAGLTGAVIVLPQGVAFATIAGLPRRVVHQCLGINVLILILSIRKND